MTQVLWPWLLDNLEREVIKLHLLRQKSTSWDLKRYFPSNIELKVFVAEPVRLKTLVCLMRFFCAQPHEPWGTKTAGKPQCSYQGSEEDVPPKHCLCWFLLIGATTTVKFSTLNTAIRLLTQRVGAKLLWRKLTSTNSTSCHRFVLFAITGHIFSRPTLLSFLLSLKVTLHSLWKLYKPIHSQCHTVTQTWDPLDNGSGCLCTCIVTGQTLIKAQWCHLISVLKIAANEAIKLMQQSGKITVLTYFNTWAD